MPKEFWEWYSTSKFQMDKKELSGHNLSKELLIAPMIQFLFYKGIPMVHGKSFMDFEDYYSWLYNGVQWASRPVVAEQY